MSRTIRKKKIVCQNNPYAVVPPGITYNGGKFSKLERLEVKLYTNGLDIIRNTSARTSEIHHFSLDVNVFCFGLLGSLLAEK
jgi:hypothetical protein